MWKGTISFGLVSVPVKLYGAVTSKTVHFNQLHGADNGRIRQKRFCSADGKEVPLEEIVKGYEIAPERYVVIEDAELETLRPEATHAIEIQDFVDVNEIEPIYFDQSYYVVPDKGGARSYRVLLEAMAETGKVAIARVVLRSRERLVAVHPRGEVLMMTTLNYADEINPASELNELGDEREQVGDRELDVARRLIESLAEPFEIDRYKDTYRDAVLDLIERKAGGEEIAVDPGPAPADGMKAPDLISALEASLEEARARGGENGRAKGKAKAPKRAPAPKRTRAKSS
jgi:DNA end-binding protein Ku